MRKIALYLLCLSALCGAALGHGKQKKTAQPAAKPKPIVAVEQAQVKPYQYGDVRVDVVTNSSPVIKLGLAQSAFIHVELPANDRIFAVHSGDDTLVTFDETFKNRKYHFVILRPGTGFIAPEKGHGQGVTIGIQMDSGMFITLMIYPVKDVTENAHRCVINYDPRATVEARDRMNLQVGLVDGVVKLPPAKEKGKTVILDSPMEGNVEGKVRNPATLLTPVPRIKEPTSAVASSPSVAGQSVATKPATLASAWGTTTTTAPTPAKKRLWPWSKKEPVVGQVVEAEPATLQSRPGQTTKAVVAGRPVFSAQGRGLLVNIWEGAGTPDVMQLYVEVRNISGQGVKLIGDQPDIFIETFGTKKARLNIEPVRGKTIRNFPTSGWMNAGEVKVMEVKFVRPILGIQQRLKVHVAQSMAADDPVVVDLTADARR
ncbi:MAG: hypothetical protein JNM09_00275 [Blastocatellia bacterium]|nr:hypothetical protein [Blastocatellia bacterium]